MPIQRGLNLNMHLFKWTCRPWLLIQHFYYAVSINQVYKMRCQNKLFYYFDRIWSSGREIRQLIRPSIILLRTSFTMTITFHQGTISHSLLRSNHFQFYIYIEAFECQHIRDQAAEVCYLEVKPNSNHIKNSICQICTSLEKWSDHSLKFWSLLIWPFLPGKKMHAKI